MGLNHTYNPDKPVSRLITTSILLTGMLFMSSCDQTLESVIDISGTWSGTATNFSDIGDRTASITIRFDQDRELLNGELSTNLGAAYRFTGSILRGDVFFIWSNTEEGIDYRFTGTMSGRMLSGTWRMGDLQTFETLNNGQWSVTRGD